MTTRKKRSIPQGYTLVAEGKIVQDVEFMQRRLHSLKVTPVLVQTQRKVYLAIPNADYNKLFGGSYVSNA